MDVIKYLNDNLLVILGLLLPILIYYKQNNYNNKNEVWVYLWEDIKSYENKINSLKESILYGTFNAQTIDIEFNLEKSSSMFEKNLDSYGHKYQGSSSLDIIRIILFFLFKKKLLRGVIKLFDINTNLKEVQREIYALIEEYELIKDKDCSAAEDLLSAIYTNLEKINFYIYEFKVISKKIIKPSANIITF